MKLFHLARSARQAGFTMIELLVVIAVIGVLAVAVLSSINPIEQINKGRDTSVRSDAQQLLGAVERYYTLQGFYPWNGDASEGTNAYAYNIGGTEIGTPTNDYATWTNLLETTSEVKAGFIERVTGEDRIAVAKPAGDNETVRTCFLPVSNQMRQQAANSCQSGLTPAAPMVTGAFDPCETTDGSLGDNYICLP